MAQITEAGVRDVIRELLAQMAQSNGSAAAPSVVSAGPTTGLELRELGEAKPGASTNEVVIALAPAFGDKLSKQTITGIPHAAVLREIMAGVEEEGVKARVVRVWHTS